MGVLFYFYSGGSSDYIGETVSLKEQMILAAVVRRIAANANFSGNYGTILVNCNFSWNVMIMIIIEMLIFVGHFSTPRS